MAKKEKITEAPDIELEILAAYYERKARYAAFDKLVDLALDGVITLNDAKTAWETDVLVYAGPGEQPAQHAENISKE